MNLDFLRLNFAVIGNFKRDCYNQNYNYNLESVWWKNTSLRSFGLRNINLKLPKIPEVSNTINRLQNLNPIKGSVLQTVDI